MMDLPGPLAVVDAFARFMDMASPPYSSEVLGGQLRAASYKVQGKELARIEDEGKRLRVTIPLPSAGDVINLNIALHRIFGDFVRCVRGNNGPALSVWLGGNGLMCEWENGKGLSLTRHGSMVVGGECVDKAYAEGRRRAEPYSHVEGRFDLLEYLFIIRVEDHFVLINGEGARAGAILHTGFYWDAIGGMEAISAAKMLMVLSHCALNGDPADISDAMAMLKASLLVDSDW